MLRAEAYGYAPAEAPFLAAGDQTVTLTLHKGRKHPRGPADFIKTHDGDDGLDKKQLEQLQKLCSSSAPKPTARSRLASYGVAPLPTKAGSSSACEVQSAGAVTALQRAGVPSGMLTL